MQIGVMAWSSLPFFFLFLSLRAFKRHPVFELTQHAVVQSWNTSAPLYRRQIAPIIVFVSASTVTCSTLCPSPSLSICCGDSQRGRGVWWVFHSCGICLCFGHVSLLPDLLCQTWTNRKKTAGQRGRNTGFALLLWQSLLVMRRQTWQRFFLQSFIAWNKLHRVTHWQCTDIAQTVVCRLSLSITWIEILYLDILEC